MSGIAHAHIEVYRPDCDACVAETVAYRQSRAARRRKRHRKGRRFTFPHLGGFVDTDGSSR